MGRDHIHQRIGSRYLSRLFFGALFLLVIFGIFAFWKIVTALPSQRVTIVADGEPVYVASWDDARRSLAILPIPGDIRIEGVGGIGSMSLSSIRKLEAIDTKKNGVFTASLQELLATPIVGLINGNPTNAPRDGMQIVKNALSPFTLSGWRGRGISFPLRARLWWIFVGIRPDAVSTVDLVSRSIFRAETLPDGSSVRVFDTNRFDATLGSLFEVDAIRREGFRVRVVNTTDIAGLGSRVARILSHAGMVVVAVDNQSPAETACTLHAKKDLWGGESIRFIKKNIACSPSDADVDERVDVTLRIGTNFFIPLP